MLNSSVQDAFKCSFNEIAETIIELARTRKRKDQAEMEEFLNVLDNNSKDENMKNTIGKERKVYRGYYTVARRYGFYVRVARTISHE